MPAPTETLNPTFSPFINNRPSPLNPNVLEYYRTDNNQGFADEQSLLAYANSLGKGTLTNRAQLLATQPSTPSTQTDPNQALAEAAARANLSLDDFLKLNTRSVTPEERTKIESDLGIPGLEESVFARPSRTTEQVYNDAYAVAGLADLKRKIADLDSQIATKKQQLAEATGVINENPFLAEASRVGRVKRTTDRANEELGNLTDERNAYATSYNSGIAEVNNLVTRYTTDFNTNQQLNSQKLDYLLKKAEQQVGIKQSENTQAALSSLPAYLTAKAKAQKPDTVTLGDGSLIQWNPDTGTFEMIVGPTKLETSLTEVNGQRVLVNTQTGEVIKVLGASGSGSGTGAGALDAIESQLMATRGSDGKVDPISYLQQRSKSKLSPDQFDKRYGYLLSAQEQKRLGIAGGTTDTARFLTPDYFRSIYDKATLLQQSGKKLGVLTRDKQQKEEQAINDYLSTLMKSIEAYRQAGYTDQEILKMMQK